MWIRFIRARKRNSFQSNVELGSVKIPATFYFLRPRPSAGRLISKLRAWYESLLIISSTKSQMEVPCLQSGVMLFWDPKKNQIFDRLWHFISSASPFHKKFIHCHHLIDPGNACHFFIESGQQAPKVNCPANDWWNTFSRFRNNGRVHIKRYFTGNVSAQVDVPVPFDSFHNFLCNQRSSLCAVVFAAQHYLWLLDLDMYRLETTDIVWMTHLRVWFFFPSQHHSR